MNEKDLMIGDLVMAHYDDGETQCYFPSMVIAIFVDRLLCNDGVQIKSISSEYSDFCDEDCINIEPIQLTAEILEKNIPFERYWDATRSDPKGSVTEWRKDIDTAIIFVWDFRDQKGEYILEIQIRGCENYGVKKNIYYVHELQHALRLCGLDELADNFKI